MASVYCPRSWSLAAVSIRRQRGSTMTMTTGTWILKAAILPAAATTNGFIFALTSTSWGSGRRLASSSLLLPQTHPLSTRFLSLSAAPADPYGSDNKKNLDDDRSLFSHVPPPVSSLGPTMGLTQNLGLTYTQSGSACLDLFFDTTPGIDRTDLERSLELSWNEDPLLTLQIIVQIGDPRRGKADRKTFYLSLLWLYDHHPKVLLHNLSHLPEYTCYRALPDLLQLVVAGTDSHFLWYNKFKMKKRHRDETTTKAALDRPLRTFFNVWSKLSPSLKETWNVENAKEPRTRFRSSRWINDELRSLFVQFLQERDMETAKAAGQLRRAKRAQRQQEVLAKLETDGQFRDLYNAIAELFAKHLLAERRLLDEGKSNLSGLAAKWAPSPRGSHDKYTWLVRGIVEKMYPPESYRLAGGTHDEYLSFMTDVYRKELSRQRRAAQVPEHFIGGGEWELVNYNRMPSLCRQKHGHIYEKHDRERYRAFLDAAKAQVDQGEAQTLIKAGVLLPMDIVKKGQFGSPTARQEANLQWLRLVQDTRANGNIPSGLAIADVSASMEWPEGPPRPIDVAIAMSMLISDVANEPWKNKLITFSEHPEYANIEAASQTNLADRFEFISQLQRGYNTNFQAVFDLILNEAIAREVPPDDMPKTLFCFSDMEFDQADSSATDVELIRRKFASAGYPAPNLVFWNLSPTSSRPSAKYESGIVFMAGYSAGLLKSFLANQMEDYTPYSEMMRMLRFYSKLSVP